MPDMPELRNAAKILKEQLPVIAATTAVNFYQQSFNSQGMYGRERWRKRRGNADAGRNVLIGKGSGALRRSIRQQHYSTGDGSVVEVFTNQVYAKIHNEGGKFVPTAKQRKFFWAMHHEAKKGAADTAPTVGKRGKMRKATAKNVRLNAEAEMWRNMALAKIITVPQRQFMDIQSQGMSESLKRLIVIKV